MCHKERPQFGLGATLQSPRLDVWLLPTPTPSNHIQTMRRWVCLFRSWNPFWGRYGCMGVCVCVCASFVKVRVVQKETQGRTTQFGRGGGVLPFWARLLKRNEGKTKKSQTNWRPRTQGTSNCSISSGCRSCKSETFLSDGSKQLATGAIGRAFPLTETPSIVCKVHSISHSRLSTKREKERQGVHGNSPSAGRTHLSGSFGGHVCFTP